MLLKDLIINVCFFRFTPPSLYLGSGEKIQNFIDSFEENSAFSLKDSYLEIDFNVTHRAVGQACCAVGDYIRLVDLVLSALFKDFRLTGNRGEEREEIDNAYISFLLNKLISNSKNSDDVSISFHRDNTSRGKNDYE